MRTRFLFCSKKKNTKAMMRLARMKAFNGIIERLAGHRGGKTFMIDTSQLKLDPPRIVITERFSPVKLSYAHCIANVCTWRNRKFSIEINEGQLTYCIY